MAAPFIITELRRIGVGRYSDTAVQFRLTADAHSAPRGGWEYRLQLRTVRTDYPGSDEPDEQVLGANYEPFELQGAWDDRYAGLGFAERTRDALEALVLRASLCRFEYGSLSFTGLITEFRPKRVKDWRIEWSFTVSPHARSSAAVPSRPALAPAAIASPTEYAGRTAALVNQAQAIHDGAPVPYLRSDLYATVGAVLADWQMKMLQIQATIDGRVLTVDARASNSIARLAAAFTSLKASAGALHPTLRAVSSEAHLGYALALPILRFEIWVRGLSVQARRLHREAGQAAAEFMRRVEPGVRAFYAPRKGESLLGISTAFYRTPNHWPAIARRNNLVGIALDGSEFLVIPEVR